MKPKTILYLLMLALLAGCHSASTKQATYEITEFYGGVANLSSGYSLLATGGEPRGSFLAITLNSPGLARHYDNLELPASGCAYLAFSNLTEVERKYYDYLKVTLQDSGSVRTFTFTDKQLQQVLQAATNLRTLVFNIQNSDFAAAAKHANPSTLGDVPPDSLPAVMNRVGKTLNPFTEYRLHGFRFVELPEAGRQPLVQLFVSIPRQPETDHILLAVINPAMDEGQPFLYAFKVIAD